MSYFSQKDQQLVSEAKTFPEFTAIYKKYMNFKDFSFEGPLVTGIYSCDGFHFKLNTPISQDQDYATFVTKFDEEVSKSLKQDMSKAAASINPAKEIEKLCAEHPHQIALTAFNVYVCNELNKIFQAEEVPKAQNFEKLLSPLIDQIQALVSHKNEHVKSVAMMLTSSVLKYETCVQSCVEFSQRLAWDNFVKFYVDSVEEAAFFMIGKGQKEIAIEYQWLGSFNLLAYTNATNQVFNMCLDSKTNYLSLQGPPGTGKTETLKDFARYTGRRMFVIDCSDQQTDNCLKSHANEAAMQAGFMVCFDCANRCVENIWQSCDDYFQKTVDFRKKSGSFVTLTYWPECKGRTLINSKVIETNSKVNKSLTNILSEDLDNFALRQVLRTMLFTESIRSYSSLSNQLMTFVYNMRQKLGNKNPFVDAGLRTLRGCIQQMGKNHRSGSFSSMPDMAFAYAIKQTLIQSFHPKERSDLIMLAAKLFNSSTDELIKFTNCPFKDVIQSPFSEFMSVKQTRHGNLVVTDQSPMKTSKELVHFLQNNSSEDNVQVQDINWNLDEKTVNQTMVKAMTSQTDTPNYIVAYWNMDSAQTDATDRLNKLLDDNKLYVSAEGSKEMLKSNTKFVMIVPLEGKNQLSPATLSRFGVSYHVGSE